MLGQGPLVRCQLGDKQTAAIQDLLGQPLMALGVETIQPGTQHRQGHAACSQRLLMTNPIDAQRQPRGDCQAAGHQLGAQASRVVLAGIGRMARAHHRQLRQRERLQLATAIEQQGGGRDLF
ncbi:hypothetical protein D3C85_1573790 [compost metagenome]